MSFDVCIFFTFLGVLYEPNHPDGPDYSTATVLNANSIGNGLNDIRRKDTPLSGLPLNIGLDVVRYRFTVEDV